MSATAESAGALVVHARRARAWGLIGQERKLRSMLNLNDFQPAVRGMLPRAAYGYVANGSEDGVTLQGNCEAFKDWRLVTRVLTDVEHRSQATTLFGRTYASPFGIAPMGASAVVAYDADNVMARAAAKARIPFILSANSIIPMEEVAQQYPGAWFAAYQSPTSKAIEGMVDRVAQAGFSTFVLTADVPVGSNRENDHRAGYSMPLWPTPRLSWDAATHPRWLVGTAARTWFRRGLPRIENLEPEGGPNLFSRAVASIASHSSLSWDHVRLIRRLWKGPFVVKGILSPQDARIARECGVDGIVVSNHGGRQLDEAVSPLQVLPGIMAEKGGMTIMIDSGFRRGTDVLKALALGADFVFIGRPFLFAAILAGEAGVSHAIDLLTKEIDTDIALLGLHDVGEASGEMLLEVDGAARGVKPD
ncbi:alpha-hydroxy acid oxidase [Rhodopila sp.]|uniref:alpha-hydroxy acid oxidase n=1 Tax=Rhodopila sp. TaxID=2480087 RepID=UPI003D09C3FD